MLQVWDCRTPHNKNSHCSSIILQAAANCHFFQFPLFFPQVWNVVSVMWEVVLRLFWNTCAQSRLGTCHWKPQVKCRDYDIYFPFSKFTVWTQVCGQNCSWLGENWVWDMNWHIYCQYYFRHFESSDFLTFAWDNYTDDYV